MDGQGAPASVFGAVDRHDMVGVGHLQPAVIRFELAGDEAPGAHREKPLEIGRIGIEIDELEGGA